MTQHTPGPWQAIAATAEGGDQSDEYFIKAHPHPAMRGFTKDVAMVEGEANARLIAAAPDLLVALQSILANHETVGVGASIFQCTTAQVAAARIALAKATA
jgi:hypothetical protein